MTLALTWPAALFAVPGLTILWWAYRRGRRATSRRVGSLIPWRRVLARLETGGVARRQQPRWLELVLDGALLVALSVGAAGPQLTTTIPRPRAVAIAIDDSVAMRTRTGGARAWDLAVGVAHELLAGLAPDDRALVRGTSGAGPQGWLAPSAAQDALATLTPDAAPVPPTPLVLALLSLPERPVVYLLARRPPPLVAERYAPTPIGESASDNAGWIAVTCEAIPGQPGVHAIAARLAHAAATPRAVRVATPAGELTRSLPARGEFRIELEVGHGAPAPERIELSLAGWTDNFADDDVLVLERAPPARLAIDGVGAPPAVVQAFERLLDALPGVERSELPDATVVIELSPTQTARPHAAWTYRVYSEAAQSSSDAPPTRFAALAPDPRLDGLDVAGVRIAGVRPTGTLDGGARVLARAADGRPLIVDHPAARRTAIEFDPREWARDPSFPVFWSRALELAIPGHGRYQPRPKPLGLAVTDNGGAASSTPTARGSPDAGEHRVARDLTPWCAGVALAVLAALAALRAAERARRPVPPRPTTLGF